MIIRFFVYIYILILLGSCHYDGDNPRRMSIFQNSMSFKDFEDITENQPEKYIHNPDSFLTSANLKPASDEEKEIYAYGLMYMAYSLREYGDIFNSIKYYEKVLNYVRENNIDIDAQLYIYKPLAALYIHVDDNQKSIALLSEIIEEIPKDSLHQQSGFLNNLANAYLYNHEPQKAIKLINDNIIHLPSSINKALLFNTLSQVYINENDTLNSRKYNRMAIEEFEKYDADGDSIVWYSSALAQFARLNNSASHAYQAAQLIEEHFPNSQFRAKALINIDLGDIFLNKKNIEAAERHYNQALQYFQQNKDKYVLDYKFTYSLLGLARCKSHLRHLDSAVMYYEWAIENDFRTQQLITSQPDQLRNNLWNKHILEELIQLYNKHPELKTEQSTATILWCVELSKARLLINEINRADNWAIADESLKNGLSQIRQLYQQYDATSDIKQKDIIQRQIDQLKKEFQFAESYFETINFNPSKETFLARIKDKSLAYYSYYIHIDNTISIINWTGENLHYNKILDRNFISNLSKFKSDYFSESPTSFNNNPSVYYETATYLYHQLLPELSKELENVFLSLDGPLFGLPYDALYNNGYLIYSHNFAYLNSFLLFDFITAPEDTKPLDIAVLYRAEFPAPLPTLPFVNKEIKSLRKKYKTIAIDPSRQNDTTIREAFAQANIIHIAAHTILDSIEAPFLYLHQAISTNQLRFFDIKTPLVFLSACNTGTGKPLPSEGTASIQRVFMSKNVPSVIATYWFANDEAMLALTSNFYERLQDHQNPMIALGQAKRDFLQNASIQQQNPWYWANINYTGVANAVSVKSSVAYSTLIIGIVLLFLSLWIIHHLLGTNKMSIKKDKVAFNKF